MSEGFLSGFEKGKIDREAALQAQMAKFTIKELIAAVIGQALARDTKTETVQALLEIHKTAS